MKRFFAKNKSTDWEKFFGVKVSSKKKAIDKEIQKQIDENSIYAVFDKSNSKEEITKRLHERKNENWKIAGIVIAGIGALVAAAKLFLNI